MLTTELQGFDALDRRLAETAALMRTRSYRAMDASTRDVQQTARRNLTALGAVDTRTLWRGIEREIEAGPDGLEGRVFFSEDVQDYAGVVEGGRRPGAAMPPIDALLPWVRRHHAGVGATFSIASHRRLGSRSTQERQDRTAAFLIARAIARRGIRARPFFEPAFREALPRVRARFVKIGQQIVADLAGGH